MDCFFIFEISRNCSYFILVIKEEVMNLKKIVFLLITMMIVSACSSVKQSFREVTNVPC